MKSMDEEIKKAVNHLAEALQGRSWQLACAESCTGGWISKCCTDREGSSAWFDRGFIAYSYPAKTDMLGITQERLQQFGAVSCEIACDLADGARSRSGVQAALSVTGVAGPGGGTASKPVGLVWFAWSMEGRAVEAESMLFQGERDAVRRQTVLHALLGMHRRLS